MLLVYDVWSILALSSHTTGLIFCNIRCSSFLLFYLGTVAPSVHENCSARGHSKTFSDYSELILLLKVARVGACLKTAFRLILGFGAQKDITLCSLLVLRNGIERSVSAFLSFLTFRVTIFQTRWKSVLNCVGCVGCVGCIGWKSCVSRGSWVVGRS